RGVDPREQAHIGPRAVGAMDDQHDLLLRLEGRRNLDVEGLATGDAKRLPAVGSLELEGQHAHADQVRAVDAFEAAGDDRLGAEQLGALGGPVARRARAVLLAAEDDGGYAVG